MKRILSNSLMSGLKKTAFGLALFCGYSVHSQVLVPYTGSTSVPCGSNVTVYAHNGSSGTYNNNANGYVVFDAGFQAVINISGTYDTELNYDYIRVYNGVGTGGTLLQTWHGNNGTLNFTGAPGQTLTLQFTSDGSVVYTGFNLNVTYSGACFATPCSGVPQTNTVIANPLSLCPSQAASLTLSYNYSLSGISYQWMSSTVSPAGPYTAISNATNVSVTSPTMGVTTWYQAVVTCSYSTLSSTTTGVQIIVEGTTINNVPYYENFEGITVPSRLPNCSWKAANLGTTVKTYTSSASNNRVALSGKNFMNFELPSTNNRVYTNGINMTNGITYSVALYFATEYFGYDNWKNLTISVGPNQSTTALVPVVTETNLISGPYKLVSATFTVPSPGVYYVAMSASGINGSAPYLNIDDLSVTIPCTASSGNQPTVNLSSTNGTICAGDQINLNASGADSYVWSTGATTNNIVEAPTVDMSYTVTGTNTLTGCIDVRTTSVHVNPTPTVFVVASKIEVCQGEPAYITAYGAPNYVWTHGPVSNVITVQPSVTTTYSVSGVTIDGCSASAFQQIAVKQNPTITTLSSNSTAICVGEPVTITALGGVSYTWASSSSQQLWQGSMITISPSVTTIFTVVGTGSNTCTKTMTLSQNVAECQGINAYHVDGTLNMYPNPTSGSLNIESAEDIISVSVLDLTGRVVMTVPVGATSTELKLEGLTNAVYFVKVSTANSVQITKIIKN